MLTNFLSTEDFNHNKLTEPRVDLKNLLTQMLKKIKTNFHSMMSIKKELTNFLVFFLDKNEKYKNLWFVCLFVMTPSHGQSQVESGFNINKELLIENLEQKSPKRVANGL